jgi:predicted GNAT family acetyltransferase
MKPPHPRYQVQFQPGVFPSHQYQDLFIEEKTTEKQIDKGQKEMTTKLTVHYCTVIGILIAVIVILSSNVIN